MPELPEVETARRALVDGVRGRSVTVVRTDGHPRVVGAARAEGARVDGLQRRAKFLLAPLSTGAELLVHLGMTGTLRLGDPGQLTGHERAVLEFHDGTALRYTDPRRFGQVTVVDDRRTVPALVRAGIEPLDASDHDLRDAARRVAGRDTPVKAVLLAGDAVAGVGNIYADEALWHAKVRPTARRLSEQRARRVVDAAVETMRAAVAYGGTTVSDWRTPAGADGTFTSQLVCYGRHGHPCLRCGATLTKGTVAGRGTTWCPSCQRR